MNPRLALRIACYLLVADAIGALLLAGLLGPLGLVLITTALGLSWWRTGSGRPMTRLDRLLVLLVAGAATIHLVYVAHAEKGLGVIDGKSLELKTDINLPGTAEAFQLETGRPRLYVNVPSPSQIVVIDTDKNEVANSYPLKMAAANFAPMPTLVVLSTSSPVE